MFGFKSEDKKGKLPIFNLSTNITGFQGPFKNLNEFLSRSESAKYFKNYIGVFHVCRNGELKHGFINGLHRYRAEFDLEELTSFSSYKHIHGDNGKVLDIYFKNDKLFLYRVPSEPIFTLDGLYSILPNQKINTKINAMLIILKDYNREDFGDSLQSIATRKETKLKLLENKYRRIVSNQ